MTENLDWFPNQSKPSVTTVTKKDSHNDFKFSTQNKYKKFSDFLKDTKKAKQKNSECNCWVCKILDSVTEADISNYEGYNIVSETGDSIFYDPLLFSNLNNDEVFNGRIFVSETAIEEVIKRIIDQRLGSSINNNKNGN